MNISCNHNRIYGVTNNCGFDFFNYTHDNNQGVNMHEPDEIIVASPMKDSINKAKDLCNKFMAKVLADAGVVNPTLALMAELQLKTDRQGSQTRYLLGGSFVCQYSLDINETEASVVVFYMTEVDQFKLVERIKAMVVLNEGC